MSEKAQGKRRIYKRINLYLRRLTALANAKAEPPETFLTRVLARLARRDSEP
jgi:hypothetical protein